MQRLNIEIKARCADPARIREKLLARQADFRGLDHQVDTYFPATNGRLKLREGNIENALIHYRRSDQAGPKRADVLLYPTRPGVPLKAVLTEALGVLTIVDKRRAIYFIDNVKFHIDEVAGLGSFVEIEAIDKDGRRKEAELLSQCRHYLEYLDIREEDLLTDSYSDMLLRKEKA